MKSNIILYLAVVTMIVSCKKDKPNEVVSEETSKPFTVTINAIVEKDDTFQIFYNEDGSDNFAPTDVITLNVIGNAKSQDIVFTLPEEVMPLSLRFDIGANKELVQVPFKGFKIEYLNNKIESNNNDFYKYFYPNTQVELDSVSAIAKMKPLKEGEGYDPILGSTPELKARIQTLYNTKKE